MDLQRKMFELSFQLVRLKTTSEAPKRGNRIRQRLPKTSGMLQNKQGNYRQELSMRNKSIECVRLVHWL